MANGGIAFNKDYPIEKAEKVLRIRSIQQFIKGQIYEADDFVTMLKMPPNLAEKVFMELASQLSVHRFPSALRESCVNLFLNGFLGPIVIQVISEVGEELFVDSDVLIDPDSSMEYPENSSGWADFVMQYQGKLNLEITHLVIIELKEGSIDIAYIQCMLYMLRAFELKYPNEQAQSQPNENSSNKKPERLIYGLCTNGVHMNAISYDGQKFKMLFQRIILIPGMDKEEKRTVERDGKPVEELYYKHKDLWIERHSEMVQIVYSCLMKAVQLNKEARTT